MYDRESTRADNIARQQRPTLNAPPVPCAQLLTGPPPRSLTPPGPGARREIYFKTEDEVERPSLFYIRGHVRRRPRPERKIHRVGPKIGSWPSSLAENPY